MAGRDQKQAGSPLDDLDFLPHPVDERTIEDLDRYKRHGLHPIIPGDILPKPSTCVSHPQKLPRYTIYVKIGFGAFSTVWLAQDADTRRLVAVKVGLGMGDASPSTEAQILQHTRQTQGRGQEHIIQLFDLFTIRGPNGCHECFVTEVVVPLSAIDLETRKNFPQQSLNRQIALGFDYLHNQRIAHGDPHHGNVGIAVPQINQFNGIDLFDHIAGELEMAPVIPTNASYPMDTVPAYQVGSISIFDFLRAGSAFPTNGQPAIRILDFGRASWIDAPRHLKGACPMAYQPPEVAMYGPEISNGKIGCAWSQQSDIWAIACLFYRIETGMHLFKPRGPLRDQIVRNIELCGPVSQDWCKYWPLSAVPPTGLDRQKVEKAWQLRMPTNSALRSLLMRMINTKPENRPSIREILADTYFGHVKVSNDIFDTCDQGTKKVDGTL
ncbi:kinase domain-containing protein [Diaporthe sp. PMI_573]|nr:kinase domain-containing protein [Diaporthaceae sp. PMI_573]